VGILVVGLGNPGADYENTRHNIGFKIADAFALKASVSFVTSRYADVAEGRIKGVSYTIIKPNTFMNLSGNAVRYYMQQGKFNAQDMMVVTDDLSLPFGTLRMRARGSSGGHNGLQHIQEILGSDVFPRLRCGIGADFHKGQQVDYVLGKWSDDETKSLSNFIERGVQAIESMGKIGIERAMNQVNTRVK
jgi:PTH1 family peptidyl-tRNA hydrolase